MLSHRPTRRTAPHCAAETALADESPSLVAAATAESATASSAEPTTEAADRGPLGRKFSVHVGTVGLNSLAGGILFAGVPLVASTLTQSPQEISMITAAASLPALLGVVAGLVVDRSDRRRLRILVMSMRVGLLAALAVLSLTGNLTLWALVALIGLYALGGVFVGAANVAMVPQVVPRPQLARANSRIQATMFILEDIIGAPIAAALVVAGSVWIFGISGLISIAAVAVLWWGLRGQDFRAPQAAEPAAEESLSLSHKARAMRDIVEGLRFMATHRVLRPVFIMSMAANCASAAYFAVLVLWMVGPSAPVGIAPAAFPLFFAVQAVGAVAATVLVSRMLKLMGEFSLMMAGFWLMPLLVVVQVMWPNPWVMGVTMMLLGFSLTVGNVIAMTMVQKLVPGSMLGRFGGASQTASSGLAPLGALAGGAIAELFGIAVLYLIVAAVLSIAFVYPMLVVRQRDVDALVIKEES